MTIPRVFNCARKRGMGDKGGSATGVVEHGMAVDGVRAHDPETVARAVVKSGAGDAACSAAIVTDGELERQCRRFG